jgi:hypothetical protein
MPSSISNSDSWRIEPPASGAPYERPTPVLQFGLASVVAVIVFAGALTAWELHWRAYGSVPSIQNSDGLWAIQRRRIDHGEGNATVLAGASRVLFDIDLDTWQRVAGERPIQLALEGTSPMFLLQDLASDPKFTGRLIVGIAPDVFFTGFAYRGSVQKYHRDETLSQRVGQWLSMHLIEPFFAFFDPDFALMTVLRRQPWPGRAGVRSTMEVRKLAMSNVERDTHIWSKVESDPDYQKMAQDVWAQDFDQPAYKMMELSGPEEMQRIIDKQIDDAAAAAARLRARGVKVVFVRLPTAGRYLEYDDREFPRSKTWDVLLQRSGCPGIHFQDYPELQGYWLPEWSHLATNERPRFTEAICRILERDYGWSRRGAKQPD